MSILFWDISMDMFSRGKRGNGAGLLSWQWHLRKISDWVGSMMVHPYSLPLHLQNNREISFYSTNTKSAITSPEWVQNITNFESGISRVSSTVDSKCQLAFPHTDFSLFVNIIHTDNGYYSQSAFRCRLNKSVLCGTTIVVSGWIGKKPIEGEKM